MNPAVRRILVPDDVPSKVYCGHQQSHAFRFQNAVTTTAEVHSTRVILYHNQQPEREADECVGEYCCLKCLKEGIKKIEKNAL